MCFLGAGNGENRRRLRLPEIPKVNIPKLFQRKSEKDPEATLASMETLEDKLDTPNDGMENIKLDGDVSYIPSSSRSHCCCSLIFCSYKY